MAVGKCKECGGQVASSAKACPHCGAKVKKSVGILGWLFVLLVVLPIAWKFGTGMGAADRGQYGSAASAPAKPEKPAWEASEFTDSMTDEKIRLLKLRSDNATLFDFPYNQAGGSYLTITFRKKGNELDAYMVIDKGQMLCGVRECDFSVRIGDGDVQTWSGARSTTNDSDVIFVMEPRVLEQVVRQQIPFRIGIDFYQAGTRAFEFSPADYPGFD
ncbi:MAG: zinc ribbon domain-containing protein [Pseudomonadota bacterium]|nr:zinc ribbon domain-containing protein [Pseudomonadota bacterium]